MNYLHDIPIGKNSPEVINVIVEIPKGSKNKYELDKETGMIALDRANYNAAEYPFDYGFIPQTHWEDGDALDVILLTTYPLMPGVLVSARPIAVMDMVDSGESDVKIIAVPENDRRFEQYTDLKDINPHTLKEASHFFETYKQLKGDSPDKYKVTVSGYEGKDKAIEVIKKSIQLYKEKYNK
jgi:inorganic pyrophosphatase